MSYRMYVNRYQFLGNNVCPQDLIEELKRQGCEMDQDYCFRDFEIKQLEPIIEILEQYIIEKYEVNLKAKNYNIADFAYIIQEKDNYRDKGLTWQIEDILECGSLFVTVNFLKSIKDDYEEYYDKTAEKTKYKIKEGHHIYMSAH